ncbi:MAG: helix-turn-helix transcriptional regulator [Campylobacterales bacterium]|nr:helix-turn-helix transcriptional regulator [Campylobacterales bacterium]
MDFREFGNEMAKLRKTKNVSQKDLSDDLHISRATISSFENGGSVNIGFKKVLQIADYLGYEIALKEKSDFPVFEEILSGE